MTASAIKIGDRVRSFDFPGGHGDNGRDLTGPYACYVEGVVIAIAPWAGCASACDHYHIRVDKRVFRGLQQSGPELVFPPTGGFGFGGDGVEKIDG